MIQYSITIMGGREVSRPYRNWFFAEGERFLSFWRCHRPRKRAALVMWCGRFKLQLEIRHTAAPTTGAKHWHRQKAVFYVFLFLCPSIYPLNHFYGIAFINATRAEAFPLQPSLFFHIIIFVAFTLPCRLQSRRQVSCLASRVK